jgi:hypothetical protein
METIIPESFWGCLSHTILEWPATYGAWIDGVATQLVRLEVNDELISLFSFFPFISFVHLLHFSPRNCFWESKHNGLKYFTETLLSVL